MTVDDRLKDAPVGTKLTFVALEDADEPLTVTEIARRTTMASSTVREAVNRLQNRDIVRQLPNVNDARALKYAPRDAE